MSLHHALAAASSFDPAGLARLTIGGQAIGWVGSRLAAELARWPKTFERRLGSLELASAPPQVLTDTLGTVVRALADEGLIRGWRNERYTIFSPASGAPLFALERAAVRAFGLTARAAHLNGFMRIGPGWRMWIARRSQTKPIDPGMLDNLVAGGVAEGMNAARTLVKECAEEAGIPAALAALALDRATLRATRRVPDGVHDEILHAYDLELPENFHPVNEDGEVAQFLLLEPGEIVARIEAGEFTVDASLVAIDFLGRYGSLPAEPGLERRLAALRVAG